MVSRLIDLPFTRGIDESTDETVLAPPGMTELVNYRLTRAGRLEHRLGVVEQSISAVVTNSVGDRPDGNKAQALHQRFLAAGGHGYTCLGTAGIWSCVGSLSRFVPFESYQGLQRASFNFTAGSCASVNGLLVVAGNFDSTGFTVVKIFDERTGALTFEGGFAGGFPRVVKCGNTAVIVTQNQSTGAIQATKINLASFPLPTSLPVETVIVAATLAAGFDVDTYDDATFLLSYQSTTFARIALVDITAFTISASAGVNDGAGNMLTTCVTLGAGGFFLVWRNTFFNELKFIALDVNLVQVGASVSIALFTATSLTLEPRPVACATSSTTAIVAWTDSYELAPFATYRSSFRTITNAPALGALSGPMYGVFVASKPFRSSVPFQETTSQPAIWLGNYNPTVTALDRSYFLMTIGNFSKEQDNQACVFELSAAPSAVPLVGSLLGSQFQVSEVVESTSQGPKLWQTVFTQAVRGLGTSTPQTGIQVYRFGDASRSVRARTRAIVPCQGSFAVLGGVPRYYDTDRLIEIGIAHGPTVISAISAPTGSMAPGTYQYVFVLEYYDGRGQRHLSYPSDPLSVTVAVGEAQVNFEVLVPSIWGFPNTTSDSAVIGKQRVRNVSLRAYRTANNGTVFRYAPATSSPNGASGGPLQTFAQSSYQDVNSDAQIAANEALYVQVGNALSNYRAPPCRFGCEHEGRLVVAGGWDPSEYIASKLIFTGEGIQFTESASFRDVCPEPITGIASLDGSLVLFAQRAIYVVNGDGPTDDGAGSFPKPRRLPGRIGCIDWRSVLTTEAGIYFRAADGIYMLPRGLAAPQFVGAPIKGKLRLYPETLGAANVTRAIAPAVSDHDSEQVLAWLVGDAEEPTAVKVFSLSLASGAWSEFSYPASVSNLHTVIGAWYDLPNQTDVLGLVRAELDADIAGSIQVENPASGYDQDISGSFEPLLNGSWRTGKVFPFGFGGRGTIRSIRLVGECLAATTLTPYIYSDAAPAGYAGSALTFTAGRFAVEIPFRHKDIAWIQVGAVDPATGSGNRGAGLRFNGLALEVEVEPGLIRSAPGNRSV